jgi:hypothetical protein
MPKNDTDRHTKHAREDSQPQVEEKLVIQSLVAKPELNGRLGEVSGALTPGGRYPVKVAGHASIIAAQAFQLASTWSLRGGTKINEEVSQVRMFCAWFRGVQ